MSIRSMFAYGLGALVLACLVSCGGGGTGSSNTTTVQFDDANLTANQSTIQAAAQRATLIVVATIQSIGTPPDCWSGFVGTRQAVTYTVSTTVPPVKGSYSGSTLTVNHVLVRYSRHARSDGQVGLSTTLFATGNQVILIVGPPSGSEADDVSENCSTLPYSANNLAALQALL